MTLTYRSVHVQRVDDVMWRPRLEGDKNFGIYTCTSGEAEQDHLAQLWKESKLVGLILV